MVKKKGLKTLSQTQQMKDKMKINKLIKSEREREILTSDSNET